MKKILLFDIDGTLLLTGGAGKIAFDRAFADLFGVENAWGQTIPDGKTDPLLIAEIASKTLGRALTPNEVRQVTQSYVTVFHEAIGTSPRFRILSGVESLLSLLSQDTRVAMGIGTGNFKETALAKLERAALTHYFAFGGYGCDSADRAEILETAVKRAQAMLRQEISKKNVWVIGDARQDIESGKKMGYQTVAVASGRAKTHELGRHRPHHLLPHLEDPKSFLKAVGLA